MTVTTIIYIIAGALFTAGALFAVARVVKGPTILDRVLGSDVLLTTLMLILGAEMIVNGHTQTVPLMIVIAATAAFSTVAVARNVSRQDRKE